MIYLSILHFHLFVPDKSVSFEKSVSFSDEPPGISPKQHSPQHSGEIPRLKSGYLTPRNISVVNSNRYTPTSFGYKSNNNQNTAQNNNNNQNRENSIRHISAISRDRENKIPEFSTKYKGKKLDRLPIFFQTGTVPLDRRSHSGKESVDSGLGSGRSTPVFPPVILARTTSLKSANRKSPTYDTIYEHPIEYKYGKK